MPHTQERNRRRHNKKNSSSRFPRERKSSKAPNNYFIDHSNQKPGDSTWSDKIDTIQEKINEKAPEYGPMIRSNLAPEVQMPDEPGADASIAQIEIYKRRLAVAVSREENTRYQRLWVKSYLWNFCSPLIKNKIKEWENYQAIEDEDDAW